MTAVNTKNTAMLRLFGVLIIGSKSDHVCVLSDIAEEKIFGMIAHLKKCGQLSAGLVFFVGRAAQKSEPPH
jgi:hypothetical protein